MNKRIMRILTLTYMLTALSQALAIQPPGNNLPITIAPESTVAILLNRFSERLGDMAADIRQHNYEIMCGLCIAIPIYIVLVEAEHQYYNIIKKCDPAMPFKEQYRISPLGALHGAIIGEPAPHRRLELKDGYICLKK